MKYYTGVGSRSTPIHVCELMDRIGSRLFRLGWTLRSGGADGADQAFETNILDSEKREIFIPWNGFNGYGQSLEDPGVVFHPGAIPLEKIEVPLRLKALSMVEQVHPAFGKLSLAAKKLHARNAFQVLGRDLKTPSKFLICWTPNGEAVGGTATAIKIAERERIPVFNLANESHLARLKKFIS